MSKQLIVIDSSVTDYESLLAGFGPDQELLLLDPGQDGIRRIADYLQGKSGYDAVQIFSHGSPGALYLGSTVLDGGNIADYQFQLRQIGDALTDGGDLLLYGCNVAQGDEGALFVAGLAQYTGADVAASDDLTGAADRGGDWVLEMRVGEIESAVTPAITDYGYLLVTNNAPVIVSEGSISLDGTGDFIDTGVTADITFADFTLEAWIKTTSSNEAILAKSDSDGTWEMGEKSFYINSNGKINFEGAYNGFISGTSAVNDGAWHHVAVVWDYSGSGSSGTGKIYVDGVDDAASSNYAANVGDNTGDTLRIGQTKSVANDDSHQNDFSGQIDDVRIWSIARSATEINNDKSSRLASGTSGLYADFLLDSSTVSSNGTYTGALNGNAQFVTSSAVTIALPTLTTIAEDVSDGSNTGASIADLVVNGSISDADGTALEAIAVTAVDNNHGTWQYSTNNGTNWNAFGTVSDASARLLDGSLTGNDTQKIRFVPTADYNGSATLTFRAWDKSTDSAGATADTSSNGGSTAYSTATLTASITVTAVNDAPVLSGDLAATLAEGGSYTLTGADLGYTDPDDVDAGVAFSVNTLSNGVVKLNGNTATSFTGTQLAAGEVAFLHDGTETSAASFKVSVEDGNEDSSTPTESTFNLTVTPVNDAPVLSGDLAATLAEGGSYTLTSTDLGYTDPDDADAGVAFSINTLSNGVIKVNGSTATSFTGTQLAAGEVAFLHDGGETTAASFKVSVEDGNEDSSTPTESTFNLTVTAVNDAPTLTAFSNLGSIQAGSQITIVLSDLKTAGDEADVDGTVDAFVIKAVSSGNLLIGGSAGTATAWNAATNDTVDASHHAYWTGSSSGTVNAFTAVAKDNGGSESATAVAAGLTVTAAPVVVVNSAPTLATPGVANYTDTAADDNFANAGGTLSGSDVDGNSLSYAGGKTGGYGTLTVGSSGAYSFVPNDSAIESLKTNASESYTVTVSDGAASASATFTVNLTGADDATIFGGALAGSVSEDGTATASGTLTVSDRDSGDAVITAQTGAVGTYGSFAIGTDGAWNYTLNNAATEVQALKAGQSVTDTFNVATAGGASQTVTLTIDGANDAPTLTSPSAAGYADTAADNSFADTTGTLAGKDVDSDATLTYSGDKTGSYGTLTVDKTSGAYTFAPNDSAIEALKTSASESYTVTVSDGTASANATLTVNLTGADDPTTFTGATSGKVTEDGTATASGTLTVTDRDKGDAVIVAQTKSTGTY
ncbi:MAG: DUF4347 domain-containing protein, partial [Methylococcaceae bacterium]